MLNKEKSRLFAGKKIMIVVLTIVVASTMVFAQGALPKKGDLFVGGKIGLGAFYGASLGFGGGFEYIVQEDFINLGDIPASLGFGAEIGYSGYSESFNLGSYYGFDLGNYKVKYTNIVILGSAFYHADVFKNEKLDAYVKFSLGYNIFSSKYINYDQKVDATVGVFATSSAIGTRYFISPALAAVAEVGWGFGILRLGLDLVL